MRSVAVWSALVLLLGAGSARAVPSAGNSHIPSHILLVGRKDALADTSSGAFTIEVRDGTNNPVANSVVEVRVLNCPGARLADQAYDAGSSIRCGTAGVLHTTNSQGLVRMTLVGGGTAGAPAGAGPCVQVFASNVPLGNATLAYLDMDGRDGLSSNDVSLFLTDLFSGEDIGRSDFDGTATLSANDLSVWLTAWGAGGSVESATSYCP